MGYGGLYGSVWNVARPSRTDPDAWVDAAYTRFCTEGLGGLRIEAIARDLGATKGSFYWHFADRRQLVEAVMARWEVDETDRYIAEVGSEPDPRRRIESLVAMVGHRRPPGEDRLYMAAVAEGVGDIVARVTRRRMNFIAEALVEYGIEPGEAERRALIAVATMLGIEQLVQGGSFDVLPLRTDTQATMGALLFS